MSRAKKKAPVLWVVLDKDGETCGAPYADCGIAEAVAEWDAKGRDYWNPTKVPHRVVKYVPEEKKR